MITCVATGILSCLLLAPPASLPAAPARVALNEATPQGAKLVTLKGWTDTRPLGEPGADRDADVDRLALGRLLCACIDVDCVDVPARAVLIALARELQCNLSPFFETPDRPAPRQGLRGDQLVTVLLHDVNGRVALEALAAQCGGEVTWQLHRGTVEFGPRESLAREDARRTKVYEVADLGLEAPYFQRIAGDGGRPSDRLRPKEIFGDLARAVSEQCEPLAFEPAPPPTEAEIAEGVRRPQTQHIAPSGGTGRGRSNVNTNATRNFDPEVGPIFVKGQWAQLQVKDKALVVTAPDFVHRAIDGYPDPLPPRVAVPESRSPTRAAPSAP